jgi:hypothetical protein
MYYFLTLKWKGGFTHIVPCRNYNLKSQIRFSESLQYVEKISYREVTEKEYNEYYADEKENSNGPRKQRKAQQENPPKRKLRKEASKDSKASAGTKRKTTPSVRKAQPSKLRESKVSDVRKPKKDVKGTNGSGTKTTTRSRSTKRQT